MEHTNHPADYKFARFSSSVAHMRVMRMSNPERSKRLSLLNALQVFGCLCGCFRLQPSALVVMPLHFPSHPAALVCIGGGLQ